MKITITTKRLRIIISFIKKPNLQIAQNRKW